MHNAEKNVDNWVVGERESLCVYAIPANCPGISRTVPDFPEFAEPFPVLIESWHLPRMSESSFHPDFNVTYIFICAYV